MVVSCCWYQIVPVTGHRTQRILKGITGSGSGQILKRDQWIWLWADTARDNWIWQWADTERDHWIWLWADTERNTRIWQWAAQPPQKTFKLKRWLRPVGGTELYL